MNLFLNHPRNPRPSHRPRRAVAPLVILAFVAAMATGAQAEYTGPSDRKGVEPLRTVAQIMSDPADDRPVVLKGKITRKASKESYVFTDATGSIRVEIDDDEMPETPVDENTVVEIVGEVDTGLLRDPVVDAERVTVSASP